MTFETTIELTITVEYDYSPGGPGARDSLGGKAGAGPPLEPDDPGELEITAVDHKTLGNILAGLTDDEVEALTEQAWEDLRDRGDDEPEPPEPKDWPDEHDYP